MKPYIIEIYALDPNDHLYVYERSYCDDLQDCFDHFNFALNNFNSSEVRIHGYHIYHSLESKINSDFVCFEDDFAI